MFLICVMTESWPLDLGNVDSITETECLSGVVGVKNPGCMGSEETIPPVDLENNSKDSISEAFYSKRHKEKWTGSWKEHRGMTGRW